MDLKELFFTVSTFGGLVVLKQMIFTVSTLVGSGGLERSDFQQFPL